MNIINGDKMIQKRMNMRMWMKMKQFKNQMKIKLNKSNQRFESLLIINYYDPIKNINYSYIQKISK